MESFCDNNYRNLKRDSEHYMKEENGNKSASVVWNLNNNLGANLRSIRAGKVLFVMHMPPPVHGASMVGKYIKDSILLQSRFECKYINMTAASDLNDIGRLGLAKILNYFKMLWNIWKTIKEDSPHVIYVTPNAAGYPFYKDFITVCLIKHWTGYSIFDCRWPNRIVLNWKSKNKKKSSWKETRKPNIIIHYHNKGVKAFSESSLNNWLYKKFFKDLYVLQLGEVLYEDVKRYVPKSRVTFCGNGLPELTEEQNHQITESLKEKYEDKTHRLLRILFLSNMMEEKGVWTLVEACGILKGKGVDFSCTFVGGWKDISEDMFNHKVSSLGINSEVKAVGAKYDADKESFWQEADVFVFPSFYHNECFPLVLLEAMQHALPCISTKEGAIPNIIDEGETGFMVEAKNPGHLAAKIEELAKDRKKCLDMGVKGFKKFQDQYTLNVFENRMCETIEQLM